MANNRDDFSAKTKLQLAKRAGWLCSDPSCRRATTGANSDGDGEINLSIAAHICAAAPEGPRYDRTMTPAQRKSADNGIWMCSLHGKAVDAKDSKYTVELLRSWKVRAEKESMQRVLYGSPTDGSPDRTASPSEVAACLRDAAVADLDVFRRSTKWPSAAIELTLRVAGFDGPVTASALASALTSIDDLILIAPPGTGKTTTVFQIADALLTTQNATPIVVPLGAWSTDGGSLLESILKRPAFANVSEVELRAVAATPGLVLLLDGWNELEMSARKRANVQIERLQLELPELGFLITTRRQALDVPIDGVRVELNPLNEEQQLEIARALHGEDGALLLDRAWRTAGIRELITVPLYLTVLLALPKGVPFPATKEEVLRRFVDAHERNVHSAAELSSVMHGLHQRFMEELAATAMRSGNTTIAEAAARRAVSNTDDILVSEGQITDKPQPAAVLNSLVSHYLLLRSGEPVGYSFQHQQFQEWFASRHVETLIIAALNDDTARQILQAEIFDRMPWEEAILFACERLARGSQRDIQACGAAIMAAYAVDPLLAAEMTFRSTDAVWVDIGAQIKRRITVWHKPNTVDRAVRFMIASGRHEFFDTIWPLITHENDQVSLSALRAARYFRTALLGSDAAERIAQQPLQVRKTILHEVALQGGADGLDLATEVAQIDTAPEVKELVVGALAFRHAYRHILKVLRLASDATFDLLVRNDVIDDLAEDEMQRRLEQARVRYESPDVPVYQRLRSIVYDLNSKDRGDELTALISDMQLDNNDRSAIPFLFELRSRYPLAIARGILERLRKNLYIFHGANSLLASGGFSLEDEALLLIALTDAGSQDHRADAAASVLGPSSIGRMIDELLARRLSTRNEDGRHDPVASNRYHDLLRRIAYAQTPNLVTAIQARSQRADNETMASLADLISRHPNGKNDRGQPFDAAATAAVMELAQDWGDRLLSSNCATRAQLASIVQVTNQVPSVTLLPLIKRLLDEDLRQWCGFRQQAFADQFRGGEATNQARMAWVLQYQLAFDAIKGSETAELVQAYVDDINFGKCAAIVLSEQWRAVHEREDSPRFRGGVDFTQVDGRRIARAATPDATSSEAEVIFNVIDRLVLDEASDEQKRHAVDLSIIAARLPHGQRGATLDRLLALAPRRQRAALMQSLVLSGEIVDIAIVRDGIAELLEEAKTKSWILTQDGYQLKEWLRLLPFTGSPGETLQIVQGLPSPQREPWFLEEMVEAFGAASSPEAKDVLFQLAEVDPRFYTQRGWRAAAIRGASLQDKKRFIDLAQSGALDRANDRPDIPEIIGTLITDSLELRSHVYDLLALGPTLAGFDLLARAVESRPDIEGLLLLVEIEISYGRAYVSWRTIENVITTHVPVEGWAGAYNVVPVSAAYLRKKLLGLSIAGGNSNKATSCLCQIDMIRDAHGAFESDPRHPDLASGVAWPSSNSDPHVQTVQIACALETEMMPSPK